MLSSWSAYATPEELIGQNLVKIWTLFLSKYNPNYVQTIRLDIFWIHFGLANSVINKSIKKSSKFHLNIKLDQLWLNFRPSDLSVYATAESTIGQNLVKMWTSFMSKYNPYSV